ncbi:MAG: pseudouridine synthase [Fusobacteriaceae bacterium]
MRLDKFLVECGIGSRKEVKEFIDCGKITINGIIEKKNNKAIDEKSDEISYEGKKLIFKEFRYYILNKKQGYVTAVEDSRDRTVMELLPDWVIKKDLFPVGRLDKDTEGLLLFTNNGKLAHDLVSPKKHVDKIYHVELRDEITSEGIKLLEDGVDIGGYVTKPATVETINSKLIHLNIQEGKFHQVKKMLHAIGNEVVFLRRITFGKLILGELSLGEVIEINLEDIL